MLSNKLNCQLRLPNTAKSAEDKYPSPSLPRQASGEETSFDFSSNGWDLDVVF